MMNRSISTVTIAALAVVASFSALAQVPLQDPKLRLQTAMKNAAELQSLGFTASFKSVVTVNGNTKEGSLKGEMLLRGQKDLSCLFTAEKEEIRLVSDGATHCLYVIGGKTYEKSEDPMPRPQLMAVITRGILGAAGTWLADFVHDSKSLLDASENVERKGDQKIGDADCEGYLLAYPGFDVTAWLTQSDPPVLRRAEVNLEKSAKDQMRDGGPVSANVQVDVTDWKPNVESRDSQFIFTAPDGVEMAKPETESEASSLEGKPAEEFELPLLDGGVVKLSALKGKTVVLDFWATWCGPCRRAMPMVEKVTRALADKGVVLYAVNQGEEAEAVKKYLKSENLNPKVALDKDSKVGQAYGARSIPTIVLVGPDGVVRKVFMGVSPQFEEELTRELTAIVNAAAPSK